MSSDAWLQCFPELTENRDSGWLLAAKDAVLVSVKQGSVLFRDGDACKGYVLVIEGAIRVQKIDPQGHEMVLYRVESGQSCMLTTTCLLGHQNYPAEGVAETDVELVLLPIHAFDAALAASPHFRRFVMANIGLRISDLMLLLEDVAFGRKDVRLAAFLLSKGSEAGTVLTLTHRQIAIELGTAREVVSRVIKDFERRGLVTLARNRITLLRPDLLQQLADGEKRAGG